MTATPRSLDARLVAPAATTWLTAAVLVAASPAAAVTVATCAGVFLLPALMVRRHLAAAALAGAALGALSAAVHVSLIHSGPVATLAREGARADVTLSLVRDPVQRPGRHGSSYVLVDATVVRVGDRPAKAPVLVIGHGSGWLGMLPGQRVRLSARLAAPRRGDSVAAVVVASGAPTPVGSPPWWQRAAGAVRSRFRAACARLPPDERGLVPGLVVGDVSQMPTSLTTAFQISGLTHLNAVSGENCAIVLATTMTVLRRTPLRRRGRLILAGVALLAFVVLARPSPSVLRAAVMGAVALTAAMSGRRVQPVPLLAGAVLLLVLVDPFLARTVGFALSVLATAAIIVIAPRWTRRLSRWMPGPAAAALAVPAAAQLACTPVLVAVFGQATPWAVPANLLAAPAVAPATVLGIVTAVVSVAAPAVGTLGAALAAVPAGWLVLVARSLAALPGADARWPTGLAGLGLLAACAAAGVVVLRARRRLRLRAMLAAWPP